MGKKQQRGGGWGCSWIMSCGELCKRREEWNAHDGRVEVIFRTSRDKGQTLA